MMPKKDAAETGTAVEWEAKLFQDRAAGEQALERLHAIGYGPEHISLILHERDLPLDQSFQSDSSPLAERGGMGETGSLAGAVGGGLIGATVAAAVGTSLAIAGGVIVIGPLVLLLVGISSGMVWGTLVGGLLELGVEAEDWRSGLRHGGIVIIVALKAAKDRADVRRALMNWNS